MGIGRQDMKYHKHPLLFRILHRLSYTKIIYSVRNTLLLIIILKYCKKSDITSIQKEQSQCFICTTSLEGTSARQSLHKTGGKSIETGTKPPVVEFKEYRELEANVNKLEQREHIRECDEACGNTRRRFVGCRGSILLDDDDDLN